jgi:hypothetical protein
METCAKADQVPSTTLTCWDEDTLVDGVFTCASDLYLLGKMLSALSQERGISSSQ